jgi:hypothetical protein
MYRPQSLTLAVLILAACGENSSPTQPEVGGDPAPVALSLAVVPNTWTATAAPPFTAYIYGYDLGMAPNSAGQSIVYTFGGTSSDEGGTGMGVQAYNVATNSWTGRTSKVYVFNSNGVGKIGGKLYFSGGALNHEAGPSLSNQLWAYDYSSDRMIPKANLPIYSAEGVTGVINGKLYVLPGACSGEGYPSTGYCAVEATRRFYRYDPTTNTWVQRRSAPHFHRQGAAAVIDGKFYVAGGFNGYEPVAYLDVYDPATNTWSTRAPLPTAGGVTGAALGGQFYVVVHSFVGTTPVLRAYAYNPATNQWKAKAAPDFVGSATRVTLDGRPHLFMVGGDQSALYTP